MDSKSLHDQLFNTKDNVYTVIDGASVPALLGKLEEFEPENTCLFRGELPFDLAEAAPYLVKIEANNGFSDWLFREAIKKPCCIFAYSCKNFLVLRKHFRSFLKVENPNGKVLHFRYYDPRVLKIYLPTCSPKDEIIIFHNIISKFITIDTSKKPRAIVFKKNKKKR